MMQSTHSTSGVMSHSNSLNSISTAVSFDSNHNHLSHSNSMDSLLHSSHSKPSTAKSKGQSSFLKRRDSGKVYDALTETSSIVTAFSDAVLENEGACGVTESLPTKLANHTRIQTDSKGHRSNFHAQAGSSEDPCAGERGTSEGVRRGRKGGVDGFSDKFVLDSGRDQRRRQLNGEQVSNWSVVLWGTYIRWEALQW